MFRNVLVTLGFLLLAAAPASAGLLSLAGDDLTWDPQQSSSPEFVIGITNPFATPDLLFGWQLGLEITPTASATGSLMFNSATLPPNYLLGGRSLGLVPTFVGPSASISVIADSDSLFTGILVPGSGANLLQTDFSATPDAKGVFQISVVPDLFQGANWFSSDFQARDFANAPFDGGPVVLGTVTVEIGSVPAVPEPSSVLVWIISIGVSVFAKTLRRVKYLRVRLTLAPIVKRSF